MEDEELLTTPKRVVPGLVPVSESQYANEDTVRREREALDGGFFDTTTRAFRSGDNYAAQILKRSQREYNAPEAVDGYTPAMDLEKYRDVIPGTSISKFTGAESPTEFQTILADVQEETRDMDILARRYAHRPLSTFVARGLAGLIDIDTPAAIFSGGVAAGVKGGSLAYRVGRGALAGGVSQAAMATAAHEAGTTGDWTEIPLAGLAGMGFGMLGGALRRGVRTPEHAANDAINGARAEFKETLDEGMPLSKEDIRQHVETATDPYGSVRAADEAAAAVEGVAAEGATKQPKAFDVNDVEFDPDTVGENLGASVGARQLNPQGSVAAVTDERSSRMIADATAWDRNSGVGADYFGDNGNLPTGVANAARRFHDVVTASGLGTDFDRLFNSGSVVAKRLAYDLMESAAGIVRNNRTASMLKENYEKVMLGTFMPHYEDAFTGWSSARGTGRLARVFSAQERQAFNREIVYELNARAYDAPGTPRNIDPHVQKAADAHDEWAKAEHSIGLGRKGEHAVNGYDGFKPYSGYFAQKWSGSKIAGLFRSNSVGQDAVEQAVAEGYVHMHGVSMKDAKLWSKAVIRRALSNDRGSDSSLVGMLQQDGRAALEGMLQAQGHSARDIHQLIERLTGAMELKSRAGHTKGRVDIDMRFTASNGIKIIDLMDTDVAHIVSRRSRGTSGAAALARKGIRSRADRDEVIKAILDEQQARGPSVKTGNVAVDMIDSDKHLTREQLDDLFSYFDAGPISGGVSPFTSRIKKTVNLAVLNQLGLTQMAEVGVQISSVGWSRWKDHAGAAISEALSKADSPLTRELKHLNVMVAEERLFRDDFALEMDRTGMASNELMQRLDHMLNTGQRVQGYISGFYAARKFQQRVAVTSMADKLLTNMAGIANDLNMDRAADIGMDPATWASIKRYVDNGTIEFKDGSLYKLNLNRWTNRAREDFAITLNRHTHQVVQKAMIGESNAWFHKDGIPAFMLHLKTFPMLAMQKQAYRNARIADTEAMYSFLTGLATAGAAYSVKQAINGNTHNLTPERIARGAFGLSNMTGWLPMWTDPLAGMLGMDSMKFNTYSQGIDNNVVSNPVALPIMNRVLSVPGAIIDILTGQMDNSSVRALQATPLIGNAYGFSAIFNALKE